MTLDPLGVNRIHRHSLQGSVFWMAPEVVKQIGHTKKADIWSVGCLVVEMLTGDHPWAQLTQMQAIFKASDEILHILLYSFSISIDWFLRKAHCSFGYLCWSTTLPKTYIWARLWSKAFRIGAPASSLDCCKAASETRYGERHLKRLSGSY